MGRVIHQTVLYDKNKLSKNFQSLETATLTYLENPPEFPKHIFIVVYEYMEQFSLIRLIYHAYVKIIHEKYTTYLFLGNFHKIYKLRMF